jgi:hypothetical protein
MRSEFILFAAKTVFAAEIFTVILITNEVQIKRHELRLLHSEDI